MACDSTQHHAVHFDGVPAWPWLPGLARLHATRRASLRWFSRMALAAWTGPTHKNHLPPPWCLWFLCRACRAAWDGERVWSVFFARRACQVAWAGGARVHFDGFPAWLWLPGLAPRIKTTSPHLGVCGFTDTKARPPNQFNNPKTKRPREAQRPGQRQPSPPSQPDGAAGPTSICLFVLVCVVWVCSPKPQRPRQSHPINSTNKKHRD